VDDVTPTVAGGNVFYTGINTAPTAITDLDNPVAGATYVIRCGSIAGGNQSTIADAGNFTLDGAWAPATVGDNITLYCVADNAYVEMGRAYAVPGPRLGYPFAATGAAPGVPEYTFIGDLNTGLDYNAADTFDLVTAGAARITVSATGLEGIAGAGFNGPLGAVGPAAATVTDFAATGSMEMGQDFGEMFNNYRRTETIKEIDDFNGGVDATYGVKYNIAGVVGAGTNTVTVRDSWSNLVTGGAGGPDMESTVTVGLDYLRAYAPRAESVVDLVAVGGQRFEWGFYGGAADYAEIVYDTAIGANWVLQVDDGGGVETIDSTIAVTVNPTKLEIAVSNAGVVTWAIDDVPCTTVGLVNNMTANPQSFRWMLTDIAAAVHTAAVDYIEIERNKR